MSVDPASRFICTVTPTIMDGTVVRWFAVDDPYADQPGVEPMLSASRNGVRVGTFLHQVPDDLLAKANEAWSRLRRDRRADLSSWATHRSRLGRRDLEPIQRDGGDG